MPKLALKRDALLPALALAGKATAKNSTIPVLQNMLLAVAGGRLTLTGSDLDAEISASTDCADADLSTTLPAGTLHDAVKKLPDGADISLDIEPAAATLVSGRSRFRLPVLPASDFPLISAGEFSHEFTVPAERLAAVIDTCSFAISTEETRYYLNGIHWHQDEGVDGPMLVAVATDGHRLAKLDFNRPQGADGMPAIIIPRRTVGLVKTMLPAKGEVTVSVSPTRIRFRLDSQEAGSAGGATGTGKTFGMLTSKLIDGTFPDYKRVVPQANRNRWRIERTALAAALDRVTTISVRGAAVRFRFDGPELSLSAANPDAGSAEDSLAVELLEGDPVEVGFNGRYCLDMLSATVAKTLSFALGGPGDPAVVTPDAADGLFVLMPMRV